MKIKISEIKIGKGRRPIDLEYVKELAGSIKDVGLLNAISLTEDKTLIAGQHRIEAHKLLGLTEIDYTISNLTGKKARLAEIDENLIRNEVAFYDRGDLLLERKAIYESLHPETKKGGDRGNQHTGGKTTECRSATFTNDTANKTGVSKRTIEREMELAKKLTPEAKEAIRKLDKDEEKDVTKKDAFKLASASPERQKIAAEFIEKGEAKDIDEALEDAFIYDNSKTRRRIAEYKKTGVKPKDWIDGSDDEILAKSYEKDARLAAGKQGNDKKAKSTINADKDPVIETTLGCLKLMIKTRGKDYMIAVCKSLKTELSKLISWAEKQ